MKKQKPILIHEDQAKKARRRARATVGQVPPARPITPKKLKPPKHKQSPGEDTD